MHKLAFLTSLLISSLSLAKSLPAGSLFQEQTPLQISLSYDISLLKTSKESLRNSEQGLQGVVTYGSTSIPVSVTPRGKGSFGCDQPQLKLNFNKSSIPGTPFTGFKKVKLFTSGICIPNITDKELDKRVLSNYLIYKLYEEVFPVHYRTRLAEISYTDTSGKIAPYKQLAFFLEPEDHIEARLNLHRLEQEDIDKVKTEIVGMTDEKYASLMHAFQFFIGNLDFGVPGFYYHISSSVSFYEKNMHLYQSKDSGQIIPIGFDWDFSRLLYFGPSCGGVASAFFIGSRSTQMHCEIEKLTATYKADFQDFHYQSSVIHYLPNLVNAFATWREKNKESLNNLGPKYSQGLDAFINAFAAAFQ
ncbi:hypothetical protein [Bdellovibrio sp. HCB2-146]|uniref:hypothetical protein n=1 Tax=Bdellovibrio sp. HCB2-146 TaxID=3394362 RepID=UPI0039BC2CB1